MPLCKLHFGANGLRLPQMNVLVLRDLLSVESAAVDRRSVFVACHPAAATGHKRRWPVLPYLSPPNCVRTAYREDCVRMKSVREGSPPKTSSSGRSGTRIVSIGFPEEL